MKAILLLAAIALLLASSSAVITQVYRVVCRVRSPERSLIHSTSTRMATPPSRRL